MTKATASDRHFWVLPAVLTALAALRIFAKGQPLDHWLPKWDTLAIIAVMFVLERTFRYSRSVSQREVLPRNVVSTLVNLYVTGFLTGLVLLPLLSYGPEHYWGRKLIFASSEQLGPRWLQFLLVLLLVSFVRYWIHRFQHANEFLWKLHSYHHQVQDLQSTNTYVSHPIDFALRNVVVYLVLGVIGFDPLVLVVATPLTNITGTFSHCGANLKAGLLNYVLVTPEVHRWHHAAQVPQGYKYSCNYGVEFSFWDALFGTFYLPMKEGETLQPERIGHPSGTADEPNYLKLLLAPLGLYPRKALKRAAVDGELKSTT
jgi:sterol desaturase/sphingolipid hydroxylase (fatty acid hydroxylase superfamily)